MSGTSTPDPAPDALSFSSGPMITDAPAPSRTLDHPDERVGGALNPHYTFEEFVIGASNRFAHAAAMSVAEKPAVCVPRHQPLLPGREQESAAAFRPTLGAWASSWTSLAAGPPVFPAASTAVQET